MSNTYAIGKFLSVGAVVGMAVLTASSAQAFTLTTHNDSAYTKVTGGKVHEIFFEETTAVKDLGPATYTEDEATYSGDGAIRSGDYLPGVAAAPPTLGSYTEGGANGTNPLNNYLTLGASGEPGPVTITFDKKADYFGLYWGSVDAYNSIDFFRDGAKIASYTGSDVLNPANGNQTVDGTTYANFFANGKGEQFDSVVLSSGSAAFESDNHAYREVPTPAVLLPSIGGMFAGAFRRKQRRA